MKNNMSAEALRSIAIRHRRGDVTKKFNILNYYRLPVIALILTVNAALADQWQPSLAISHTNIDNVITGTNYIKQLSANDQSELATVLAYPLSLATTQGMQRAGPGTAQYDLPIQSEFPFALAQADSGQETDSGEEGPAAEEMTQIAEALANPLSHLWLLFAQNDTYNYTGDLLDALGEDDKVQNSLLLMPVMPFQLTEDWKVVFRLVVPVNDFETVDNVDISTNSVPSVTGVDFTNESGIGDIVLWTAFSNQYKPPFIWGFGPTIMLDTAAEDQLGTGKNSIGPMALAFSITDKWILGGIFQHWESVGGDDSITVDTNLGAVEVDRPDVSLTDIQYVIRYRYSVKTNIGAAPNIRYNHETDELSLPIGIGFDTLVKMGPLPVKVGGEIHYYVEQDDDFGPEWLLRLYFSPVVPSPAWSKEPLFD